MALHPAESVGQAAERESGGEKRAQAERVHPEEGAALPRPALGGGHGEDRAEYWADAERSTRTGTRRPRPAPRTARTVTGWGGSGAPGRATGLQYEGTGQEQRHGQHEGPLDPGEQQVVAEHGAADRGGADAEADKHGGEAGHEQSRVPRDASEVATLAGLDLGDLEADHHR